MGRVQEILQPPLVRCVAIYKDGKKKIRHFPDSEEGVRDAVAWEWEQINSGAAVVEFYRDDEKKGTFYSPHWVRFTPSKNKSV